MATKPTETLNFEPPDTSGGDTVTVIVPADKQAAGFVPAEKAPAQYFNWLFRTLSRLYNYVKDGNFTGDHTITGTFDVIGNTSITGTHAVSSDATVGGTLGVTGNTTLSGTLSAASLVGAIAIGSSISPSTIATGSTHNYNPTGLATATWLKLTPTTPGSTLTGIAGGVDGRILVITNMTPGAVSAPITLAEEDANSTAANRFETAMTIAEHHTIVIIYDGTAQRWRPFAASVA